MTKEEFEISAGKLVDILTNTEDENTDKKLLEFLSNDTDLATAMILASCAMQAIPEIVKGLLTDWQQETWDEAHNEIIENHYDEFLKLKELLIEVTKELS